MPRSKVLDGGEEIAIVYPEVLYTDDRGNRFYVAGEKPEKIRVTVSKARTSSSDLPGQVSIQNLKCTTRRITGWDWDRIVLRGEEWDLTTPPHIASGVSRASRHYEFELRSRNKLDNKTDLNIKEVGDGEVARLG